LAAAPVRPKLVVNRNRAILPDCYDGASGKPLWSIPMPAGLVDVLGGIPHLLPDGRLLLLGEKSGGPKIMLTLQTQSQGLSRPGWPAIRHDNQNTAYAASPP
jgi:hypothetical protein